MLTATAKVVNNYIGIGAMIPIRVIIRFGGTMRVVIPALVRTYESPDCTKFHTDIQALLVTERHSSFWNTEEIINWPIKFSVITNIKVFNLHFDYCGIQRHPEYAVGRAFLKYDLAIFYLDNACHRVYHVKGLSTLLRCKLDCIPPPEAKLIIKHQAEILDLMAPEPIILPIT